MPTPKTPWYADGLHFTCHQCGNCCSGPPGYVWFDEDEAAAMAAHLNLSVEDFRARHARKEGRAWTLGENLTPKGYDCVFLRRDAQGKALCSIYTVRPRQCRTWPFWNDNLGSPAQWNRSATRCAGMAAGAQGQGRYYPIEQIRIIRDGGGEV